MELDMKTKLAKLGTAAILSVAALATAAPAMAHGRGHGHGHYRHHQNYQPVAYNSYDDGGYYRNARYERRYDDRGYRDGYRCKPKGTGGLVIGAVVGGLLGREVVGRRGDRTAGAVVGAGAGALAGRALHRAGSNRC
jgi:hypothetical protein